MNKKNMRRNYEEFIDRKRNVGFAPTQIMLMAFTYLDALCENGLLEWSEHSEWCRYAEKVYVLEN